MFGADRETWRQKSSRYHWKNRNENVLMFLDISKCFFGFK